MSDKYKNDGFFNQVSNFFKRVNNQDLIKVGGKGGINVFNAPQTKQDLKTKMEFQVLRQFLQQKNWNLRHIELYDEYRRMDSTYPIIHAALSLYAQEVCLTGDTKVSTMAGDFTIKELYDLKKKYFLVRSYNPSYKKIKTYCECSGVKNNGIKKVYEVVLNQNVDSETLSWDNKYKKISFKCTDNHKIYVGFDYKNQTSIYKELKDLKVGDELSSFYDFIDPSCNCKEQTPNSSTILEINYVGEEEVYDLLNVAPYHHFAIKLTDSVHAIVHNCSKDAEGNIFKLSGENSKVLKELENCYYDNLKLDSRAYLLVRSMMKFGNSFSYLQSRRGEGVTDLIQLPPESIRINLLDNDDRLDLFRYNWYGYGGNIEFEPWEVVHWKIIQDIETEPYGQSILRSVVETWRRIILMREALIIYRITRAPQRFLYKIDTTGLDPDAALRHAQNVKEQLTRKPMTDPKTGEMDYRYMPMPIHKDSPIPLLDGRTISIEELAKEYELGFTNYVYSIKDETHEPVAGKVVWCGKNYIATKLVKVWLDNDSYVLSAPEHPFMRRDGSKVNAENLKEGDSLMPGYLSEDTIGGKSTYTTMYSPATEKFEFVHRLVNKEQPKTKVEDNVTHHKDFNRYNNRPDNLQWMNFWEHRKLHSDLMGKPGDPLYEKRIASIKLALQKRWTLEERNKQSINTTECNFSKDGQVGFAITDYNHSELHGKHNVRRKRSSTNMWKDEEKRKQIVENKTTKINNQIIDKIKELIINRKIKSQSQALDFINNNCLDQIKKDNPFFKLSKVGKWALSQRIKDLGFENFSDFQTSLTGITENSRAESVSRRPIDEPVYMNHKVKRIEFLDVDGEDVYCMTVMGPNGEHDRHNFVVGGHKENNEVISANILIFNSVTDDIYQPTFEGDVGDVRVLEGASNIDAVEDYKIIKDDLFAGLLIPKAYLTFEEDLCVRANTIVKTTEGKLEMQQIASLFEKNDKLKIYTVSCDEKGFITQGKILWCKPTKEVTSLHRIHLSNNRFEDVTENHPFLTEDLIYIRADELVEGVKIRNIYNKDITVTKVEIIELEQKENVYDLEVEKHHNFALDSGIFVHNSNKAALAQEDMRFSNAVRQYQSYFVEGLLHIGLVHLYLNGHDKEDLESFSIEMNNSSTLVEKNRNELLQQRIDLAKSALDTSNGQLALMSYTDVLRNILHFTEEEISRTFKNQFIEKKIAWRLQQISEQGFYEEPDSEKRKAKMKDIQDTDDVFKELQFESKNIDKDHLIEMIKDKVDQEIKVLSKNVKVKPSKKQINKVIVLNESNIKGNIKKTFIDLGLDLEKDFS